MMSRWTLYSALVVTITCVVLLSMSLAAASGWTERMTSPVSRTVIMEAPRNGDGREVRAAPGMSLLGGMSEVLVGVLLGLLLGYRVLRGRPRGRRSQGDIDQLTEQFQALFREIDRGKQRYP